jgi:hypothetical protein
LARFLEYFQHTYGHDRISTCLKRDIVGWQMQMQTDEQGLTVFGHLLRNKSATRGADSEGEPMLERRDEMMPEPGGYFELGGCLASFISDHDASWR